MVQTSKQQLPFLVFKVFYTMSRKHKMNHPEGKYFVCFATVNWKDVFVRPQYFELLVDSLNFSIEKTMVLYAY